MATKAGVWIDHKQAIVVLTSSTGPKIKKFTTGGEQPAAAAGATHIKKKYTPNDFVAEDRQERKVAADRKQVFAAVLTAIGGADGLLILGPGEAKGEFSKYIKAKKIRGIVVELETADKLTDRQIAALVQKHFAASPAKKAAALKKPVKKVAKSAVVKRAKSK